MNYFENLTCNSDDDCPERANCIGNKCVTTFFCADYESTCALLKKKEYEDCKKNEDCISRRCGDGDDDDDDDDKKKYCRGYVTEYSTGLFTYEHAKTYFENIDINCKNEGCPNHSYCDDQDKCLGDIYCKKDDSICSFLYDREKGLRREYHISKTRIFVGLKEDGEDCRYDGECKNLCRHKDFFGKGWCSEGSDSDYINEIGFWVSLAILIYGEIFICACLFIAICYKYIVNYIRKMEGLNEKKFDSVKSLAISATVLLLLIFLLFGFLEIDICLNKKSYTVSYIHFYFIISLIFILFSIGICHCVIFFINLNRIKNGLHKKEYSILKYLKIASIIIGVIFLLLIIFAIIDAIMDRKSTPNSYRDFPIC